MSLYLQSSKRQPCPRCGDISGDCRSPKDNQDLWLCISDIPVYLYRRELGNGAIILSKFPIE